MNMQMISIDCLMAHPANSNVMPPELLKKLASHLERTDRYPPVIVRPMPSEAGVQHYQILDGHHRVKALQMIGRTEARCVAWEVDDAEALVLMATLNRLQGRDDPRKRAALVDELAQLPGFDAEKLAAQLPESLPDLEGLLALHALPEQPRQPRSLVDVPVAVHFFLTPGQRSLLEKQLREIGGGREEALMTLVESGGTRAA